MLQVFKDYYELYKFLLSQIDLCHSRMNIKNTIVVVTTFIPTTCTSNFGLLSNTPSLPL